MTSESTRSVAAHPASSEAELALVDRPADRDRRSDALPRRPIGDSINVIDAALAAHEESRGHRTTFVDGEFNELATSVRKWLVLSRSEGISTTTATERPDLRVPDEIPVVPDRAREPLVPALRRQGRENAVADERPALLIDAEHVSSDRLPLLLETVRAAYGVPVICRAYADWSKPELQTLFADLRHWGIQPMQNFDTREHSRSLVALALDALDVVERYAVTCAVLVGDLGAALPLVTRLKAKGVEVAVIGSASNPDDVRRAVDEFVDIASLSETARRTGGRHRA